jgi:hypothetical protein
VQGKKKYVTRQLMSFGTRGFESLSRRFPQGLAEHFHLPLSGRGVPIKRHIINAASSYVAPDGKWDFSSTGDYYCYTAATSRPVPGGGGGGCQNQTASVIVPSIKCHFSVNVGKS